MSATRPTTLLVLPGLALAACLLAGCVPGTPTPSTPTPDESSSSSTPTPEPTETEAADDGTGDADNPVDPEVRGNIVDAVSSGNTAALPFAATVHVTYAASEEEGDVSDYNLLVMDVSNATSMSAVWDFNLPAALIATYRGPVGEAYYDDFPEGAIVGRSSEDKVISFVVSGGQITRLFISNSESALT
jgi:hypothetical protein